MVGRFVGRERELALLRKRLDRVRASGGGVAVAVHGRRRVGRSHLVLEFCDRADVPYEPARTAIVIVSLSGVAPGIGRDAVDVVWTAGDVVAVWC